MASHEVSVESSRSQTNVLDSLCAPSPVLTSPISKSMQMDDVLVFQPDGDVLIRIENCKLLVSSKVLSSISPVFSIMFNGGFKEGIKTQFEGHDVLHQVSLPEDNIDSVILFCTILHGRQDLITKTPDVLCLLELAVLCDKYQCSDAMRNHLDTWIQKSLDVYGVQEKQNACALLMVAFINDSRVAFRRLSELILNYFAEKGLNKNERLSWYLLMHHHCINADFASAFESVHKNTRREIDRMFSAPFEDLKRCICLKSANIRAKKAASFTEQLFHADLMPSDVKGISVADIITRVNGLPNVECRHYKRCPLPTKSLKEMLQTRLLKFNYGGKWLCLSCLKTNRTAGLSWCRFYHHKE